MRYDKPVDNGEENRKKECALSLSLSRELLRAARIGGGRPVLVRYRVSKRVSSIARIRLVFGVPRRESTRRMQDPLKIYRIFFSAFDEINSDEKKNMQSIIATPN